jgi:protein-tyrosine-phosphatase
VIILKKVIFVCTGNTCRSPMAEIIASKLWDGKAIVISRGFCQSGAQMSKNAIEVLEARGFKVVGEHYSVTLSEDELNAADLVLTMTSEHKRIIVEAIPSVKDKVFTLREYVGDTATSLDIADPYMLGLKEYDECCEQILNCIKAINVDNI